MTLTAKRLRDIIHYNDATGDFTWKVCRRIAGRPYSAHRLAWLYMTGKWPPGGVDHANTDKGDNRYANLRLATGSQNKANTGRQKNNVSGFKGVTWFARTEKWKAGIKRQHKTIHLGYFDSAEEAHAAYCSAALRLYGEFARPS